MAMNTSPGVGTGQGAGVQSDPLEQAGQEAHAALGRQRKSQHAKVVPIDLRQRTTDRLDSMIASMNQPRLYLARQFEALDAMMPRDGA